MDLYPVEMVQEYIEFQEGKLSQMIVDLRSILL